MYEKFESISDLTRDGDVSSGEQLRLNTLREIVQESVPIWIGKEYIAILVKYLFKGTIPRIE